MSGRLFSFVNGSIGPWAVLRADCIVGEPLVVADRIEVIAGPAAAGRAGDTWVLRGMTSNERYVTRDEKSQLVAVQEGLGRAVASRAAMIPMRKNATWWSLTQDERRAIFEEQSHHVRIGLKHLPPVARRLHHCRDLSEQEPFDFITWFEYAPEYEAAFDQLVAELRRSPEWTYVDREIDIRLAR